MIDYETKKTWSLYFVISIYNIFFNWHNEKEDHNNLKFSSYPLLLRSVFIFLSVCHQISTSLLLPNLRRLEIFNFIPLHVLLVFYWNRMETFLSWINFIFAEIHFWWCEQVSYLSIWIDSKLVYMDSS